MHPGHLCTKRESDPSPRRPHTGIPRKVLQELEGDLIGVSLEGRRDMTHLTTSIDDEHTDEIDDAFALEGNRLHVFIADVSHYVPIGSAFDEEASTRLQQSTYLREALMLPAAIGQDLASSNHGETRPALCFGYNRCTWRIFRCRNQRSFMLRRPSTDYNVDSWLATGDAQAN